MDNLLDNRHHFWSNLHELKAFYVLNQSLHIFFYKQPVYKQLLWLDALSLSNNLNYRLKKIGVFPFVINVK